MEEQHVQETSNPPWGQKYGLSSFFPFFCVAWGLELNVYMLMIIDIENSNLSESVEQGYSSSSEWFDCEFWLQKLTTQWFNDSESRPNGYVWLMNE